MVVRRESLRYVLFLEEDLHLVPGLGEAQLLRPAPFVKEDQSLVVVKVVPLF